MEFVLIVFFYIGGLSDKDSMATAVVPGFYARAECEAAGRAATDMAKGTKDARYVCVQRTPKN